MANYCSKFKAALGKLNVKLMLRWSTNKRIDGLWVGCFDSDSAPSLNRVEEALCLIKKYDRRRYDHLIRDLERIWVLIIPGGIAHFDSSIWACVLDPRHVLNEENSAARIAASIVHEATHARLWRRGIGYQENMRLRVEAVCFRSEQAFAARIPEGEQIAEQAERMLAHYADQVHWTDQAFRQRHNDGSIEALRYLKIPNWLIRRLESRVSRPGA
jgi:hypothetical protein